MGKVEAVIVQPQGKAEKFKQLLSVEKVLNEKFKTTNSIVRLGDKVGVLLPSLPSNLYTLDYKVIGTGGMPKGRIIEILGPESSGKTTIALQIIGVTQKNGGICAFVDAEHALDPTYAAKLGVNVDELLVSQPDSGEQALETVEHLVESKLVDLIVVDSVAALVPQAELDGDMGDSNIGLQARLMSQAMRKLRGICNINGVTVIFINQIREKIGVMFGSPETTTGGRALKFYSSVRLDVRRQQAIRSGETVIGHPIKIRAVKNKVAAPFRETTVDLIYESGLDTTKDFIKYAVEVGAIEQSGKWYKFDGKVIGNGEDDAVNNLKENEELMKQVKAEVLKAQEIQRNQ